MGQENIKYDEFEVDCIPPGQQQLSGPKAPTELSFDVDAAFLQANQNTGIASGTNDPKNSADNVVPFVDQCFTELQVVTRKAVL